MRLGGRSTLLRGRPDGKPCLAHQVYGADTKEVHERHRHRYEVNPELVDAMQAKGLFFVGVDDTGKRMEIVERSREEHPFFLGVQYHPEFTSRPNRPSPPFLGFVLASAGMLEDGKPVSAFLPEDLQLHGGPVEGLGSASGAAAGGGGKEAASGGLVSAAGAGSVAMDAGEGEGAAGGRSGGLAGSTRSWDEGEGEEGAGNGKKPRVEAAAKAAKGKAKTT